jgi:hypothetical protein
MCLDSRDTYLGSSLSVIRHTLSCIQNCILSSTVAFPSAIRKGAKNPSDVTERPLSLDRDFGVLQPSWHAQDESRVIVSSEGTCFARTFRHIKKFASEQHVLDLRAGLPCQK